MLDCTIFFNTSVAHVSRLLMVRFSGLEILAGTLKTTDSSTFQARIRTHLPTVISHWFAPIQIGG